ncbi:hypothetical protein CUMW_046780 [Citrus unshiu]|nr:hypothetical protein CUMW_046780 [Citrus unshiu]
MTRNAVFGRHYWIFAVQKKWEDDSASLSEDQEPRTENGNGNGNGNNRRTFILPFPIDEWESRLDELEEHLARVEARFGRIQERMLFLRKALRVVSALFIVTLAYAIHK